MEPSTEPAGGRPLDPWLPLRHLAGAAGVLLLLAIAGRLLGASAGGLGPALWWGGITATGLLLLLAIGVVVLVRRMDAGAARSFRRLWSGFALAVAAALSGVLAFELQLQLEAPLPPREVPRGDPLTQFLQPDPELGWIGRPGDVLVREFGGVEVTARNNRLGFEDIDQEPEYGPRARPRVVVVGDSLATGYGVATEEGLTAQLRAALPEGQVFLRACRGWFFDQILINCRRHVTPLQPRFVLLVVLFAPGLDDSLPLYYGVRKPWYELRGGHLIVRGIPVVPNVDPAANLQLWLQSEADRVNGPLSAFEQLWRRWLPQRTRFGERLHVFLSEHAIARRGLPPPKPITLALVRALREEVERSGARLLVAAAPAVGVFDRADPVRAFAPVVAAFAAAGGDAIDLTPQLLPEGRGLFTRDNHPDPTAHQRIGRRLAAALRERWQ